MSTLALSALFLTVSQTYNLPPGLLSALCFVESSHNVAALVMDDNGTPSVGVCQVKLATARTLGFKGTETQLRNPKVNVRLAGKYLAKQIRRYDYNLYKGVAAYNSGTWRMSTTGYARNSHYVVKVLNSWAERQ